MKKLITCLLIVYSFSAFSADQKEGCRHWPGLFKPLCQNVRHIWLDGDNELLVTGYAWHNRYTYRPEKIRVYNEQAWGGGFGKGIYYGKNDWQGLFAMAFLDSHKNLEPAVGYAYLKMARFTPNLKAGLGFTVLATMRNDINNGYPFPGVLPWSTITYKKFGIIATYIPGAAGAGNVLFLIGRYTF